jgi:lysozyme
MSHITSVSNNCVQIIQHYEGFRATAYECPTSLALSKVDPNKAFYTIGFGQTFYENDQSIKKGDVITLERGIELLTFMLNKVAKQVDVYTRDDINQNQMDAICSFTFNIGIGNLHSSTLLKLININPNDFVNITAEFMKWNQSDHVVLDGLTSRRHSEATLYSTGKVVFYN